MIRGLVITHGQVGDAMVRVVEMIVGPVAGLTSLSNSGKSAPDISREVGDWLDSLAPEATDGGIIMVDDYGGSCATSAQIACAERAEIAILSGVNLAMLLGFVTWREGNDSQDLARKLVQKSREAITLVRSG
jgi:mannose/fructose-specific phosphotransferase system component IIA